MINRLAKYVQQEPEDEKPEGDYWVVSGQLVHFYVSRETADALASQIGRLRRPRWLRFIDLFGSEVRVRTDEVRQIAQCTAAQREAERRFRKARHEEDKAGRNPWDDDYWF